ncbi:ABC-F family ATP-binding cassette domain-containing protein [Wohlfahrtiimonas chitiniclastica]|uniref:ABC-F family ATP-binding cassette domain-containing protein n=1 Tax=Wohlfahrtiimonas chitiniclastica TaxID=400946 RepID=UPI0021577E25|nr:ATP-binding cassette domain-containing protein [Wohlfahrtiimonas chitiniclastica]MDC7251503.1 ABC transporter ATP-binding protein [Wohlfahrtiimonas chitiniclastica]
MIDFNQITLRVGTKVLIEDFSMQIHNKMHVGLVGKNGTGKTSLFNLILGHYEADKGNVHIQPHLQMAHVEQEIRNIDQTAFDYVLSGDAELIELRKAEQKALDDNDGIAISHIHQELERIDGYRADSRAAALMTGLGFNPEDLHQPIAHFSGGWRMRLNIAKALMCRSDILLLDEPTNHLDFETVVWLENWLKGYQGILIIISHDKEFLDHTCNYILHLEQQKANLYKGNYADFQRMRAEKLILQQTMYEKNEKTKAHLENFIRRFGAKATKAKQAQSRVKALAKLADIAPVVATNEFTFSFLKPDRLPDPLLTMDNVAIGYEVGKPILNNVNLTLTPDTRLGLLGKNGEGKSTLIKAIAGQLSIENGDYTASEFLNIGYFAQHQLEYLTVTESPMWHIQMLDPLISTQEIRNFLGQFDFHGDKALESIERFSGGEKARLALAMIVYQKPNLLLLDEPTNHLDLEMREAIAMALQAFEGGVVIVSHDASLLEMCCDQFAVVRNHHVSLYDGDLESYRTQVVTERSNDEKSAVGTSTPSTEAKLDFNERKNLNARLKKLERDIPKLEAEMAKIEAKIAKLDDILGDSDTYLNKSHDEIQTLNAQKDQCSADLAAAEEAWLMAGDEIETITAQLNA